MAVIPPDPDSFAKLVVVGDSGVGKTALLISYSNNSFPIEYIPSVFDVYDATTMYDHRVIILRLQDTSSTHARLRQLAYPGATCIFMTFSFSDPLSLESVKTKWYPEVCAQAEGVPLILIGLKRDLKNDLEVIDRLMDEDLTPVTSYQAWTVANEIHAVGYFETSARCGALKEAFQEVLRIHCIQQGFVHIRRGGGGLRGVLKRLFRSSRRLGLREAVVEYGKGSLAKLESKYREEELKRVESVEEWKKEQRLTNIEVAEFRQIFVDSGLISQDLIFHILHEYVLVDLRDDVPGFKPILLPCRREFNLSINPTAIHQMWFGLLGSVDGEGRREIRQLFCHFHIPDYRDVKFLPKFTRTLWIGYYPSRWDLLASSALSFYSRRLDYDRIRVRVPSHEFQHAVRVGGVKIAQIECSTWNGAQTFGFLNSGFPDLLALSLFDHRFETDFEDELALPNLRSLLLYGTQSDINLSFESLPQLNTLKLVGSSHRLRVLSSPRFSPSLEAISCLRSILFHHIEFVPSSFHPWLLLSQKKSLEEFCICQCCLNFQTLENCEFPMDSRLRVLVIYCRSDETTQEVFPSSFVERVQGRAQGLLPEGESEEAGEAGTLRKRKFSIFKEDEVCFGSFKYILKGVSQLASNWTAKQIDRFVALHCGDSN